MNNTGTKISVFGLGYVGLVSAVCLAEQGHQVVCIEKSAEKAKLLKEKKLYIHEPRLAELFEVNFPKLQFSSHYQDAISSQTYIICVGTPAQSTGNVDLTQIEEVSHQVADIIKQNQDKKLIIIRSTIPPSTTRTKILKIIESFTGKQNGKDFDLVFQPEFLREGNAVKDFFQPSLNILGTFNGDQLKTNHMFFSSNSFAELQITSYEEAEMIKYLNNTFHALKVAYANEIGTIANQFNINIETLFDLFFSDKTLNLSSKYLSPGFSFGGTCLKKDTQAINFFARENHIKTPLLDNILNSNSCHTKRFIEKIEQSKFSKILFMGITFKPNTNDFRGSEILKIIQYFLDKPSYQQKHISIFDQQIVLEDIELNRVNKISNASDAAKDYDLIVIGSKTSKEIIAANPYAQIIDLQVV